VAKGEVKRGRSLARFALAKKARFGLDQSKAWHLLAVNLDALMLKGRTQKP
jgi:hypothetical protein